MSELHPVIVTLTGPSGSGKTVLSNLLKDTGMEPLVSTTTRAPRQGESEGVDYHFISREQFAQDLADNKFIENIEYNRVLYGVSVDEAQRAFGLGKTAVLVAEPHGVEQIKKFAEDKGWHVLRVFVDNPENVLLSRLLNRLALDVSGSEMTQDQKDVSGEWVEQLKAMPASYSEGDIRNLLVGFIESLGVTENATSSNPRIGAAAQRLKSFQFEQANWVDPARSQPDLYEYVVSSFDQDVQDQVVSEILGKVQKLTNPDCKPPQVLRR